MTHGKVTDMDVVTNASAVRSVVIGAEDVNTTATALVCLENDRYNVVGRAFGIFANQTAGMRASGVKVA